jgi:translation initiation factor 3 subunit E
MTLSPVILTLLTPVSMLSQKLNMEPEAAEKWIVNLIRNAKLDAKIDSQANTVIMGSQYPSVYQKVIVSL